MIKKLTWDALGIGASGQFEYNGYQGLASHGGAVGIFIAAWLFSKKYKVKLLWLLDRPGIVIALSGFFIRTGNFFNSEIIGKPSNLPWAVIFGRVDDIPRHPAMLYEAVCYLAIFFILYGLYRRNFYKARHGLLLGFFLVLLFGVRFFVEFVKETQEAFERNWPLNLGQLLSVPFIITGFCLIIKNYKSVSNKKYLVKSSILNEPFQKI